MRRAVLIGLVAAGLDLVRCSKDEPSDYNADVEKNFLETCREDYDGPPEVCQCAYDGFEESIPYDRFKRVDDRLREDPTSNIPDDFASVFTDCVVQFGDLPTDTPTLPTTTTTAGATTTT